MPPKREKHTHLPPNVYLKCGTYYFVKKEGKKRLWIKLGKNLSEAFLSYAKIIESPMNIITMNDLFDRYIQEIILPKEKNVVYTISQINRIRQTFGHCYPEEIIPQDIYRYMDERQLEIKSNGRFKGDVAANREKSILSHIFTLAIRWGVVNDNPCKLVQSNPEKPRDRYITDEELLSVMQLCSPIIALAMDFAYITGQRRGDIIDLKHSQLIDDGVLIQQGKTGKKLIIEWSDDLRKCIDDVKKIRHIKSEYVFCTEQGTKYTGSGFGTLWKRGIEKALKSGAIKESFTFHDIRAKSASDTACKKEASGRLGHSDTRITERVYLRKPTKVSPLK